MDHKNRNFRNLPLSGSFIFCLSVLFLMTSGCAPLRKKFTRKKKDNRGVSEKFIPILDPIDYPEKVTSSEEKYKHHYSLWKVWNKDLLQNIALDSSEKRQKYLLNQTIEQLEEMKVLLADEKLAELDKLIDGLRKVQLIYEKPSAMRSKFSVRKKIELNAKAVRNGFSPRLQLPYRDQM